MLYVIAKYMANILAKIALDTLTKFLYAINIGLVHPPRAILSVRCSRIELFDAFLDLEVPTNIRDQVLDRRKRPHRLDGHRLCNIDRVQPRHTHELWLAVDL